MIIVQCHNCKSVKIIIKKDKELDYYNFLENC